MTSILKEERETFPSSPLDKLISLATRQHKLRDVFLTFFLLLPPLLLLFFLPTRAKVCNFVGKHRLLPSSVEHVWHVKEFRELRRAQEHSKSLTINE